MTVVTILIFYLTNTSQDFILFSYSICIKQEKKKPRSLSKDIYDVMLIKFLNSNFFWLDLISLNLYIFTRPELYVILLMTFIHALSSFQHKQVIGDILSYLFSQKICEPIELHPGFFLTLTIFIESTKRDSLPWICIHNHLLVCLYLNVPPHPNLTSSEPLEFSLGITLSGNPPFHIWFKSSASRCFYHITSDTLCNFV